MADHAHRGEAALKEGNTDEAIAHFTEALKQSPSPLYYIKRSTAFQRRNSFLQALQDAEAAVVLAVKRAKRELIGQAQLRRAIALYHMEQYANAKFVFGLAKKYDDKDKSLAIWEMKVDGKLKGLGDGNESAIVSTKEVPDDDVLAITQQPFTNQDTSHTTQEGSVQKTNAAATEYGTAATSNVSKSTSITVSAGPSLPTNIRHEWYQNAENVYVTLLAKGVPKEQASIDIGDNSLSVAFPLATGSNYDFTLDPFFAAINSSASTYKILSTKIEITLRKQMTGQKWPSLEGTGLTPTTVPTAPSGPPTASHDTISQPTQTAPSYPTSSRSGPKNWDKIADSYKKPATSKKDTDDADAQVNKDGDFVDSDEEGGDPVNSFFKKLYKDANEDTRRAMIKSYQESGGTALSTNWSEVGKAPVPVSPPDGMEAKKWEH